MNKLTKEEIEENYRARLRSETFSPELTKEQEKLGEERRKSLNARVKKELIEEGYGYLLK